VLNWFKRFGAPKSGPDYRHIDTSAKAEMLCKQGGLKKLLLLPPDFGGEDAPPNVVFVPAFAAELKVRIDMSTVMPLAHKGQVSRYTATPEYEGKSVVPSLIRISATDPGCFEGTVAIWGRAVQQDAKQVLNKIAPAISEFIPSQAPVETMGPEDFVRAYIDDYERWNEYANWVSEQNQNASASMAATESAYATLLQKYCFFDHEHQPIAFGSDSSHSNRHEIIVGTEIKEDSCVVSSSNTKTLGNSTMTYDYEYVLKKVDQRWFLTSVLYIDEDGRWEGL
jgi:hypothetical protein